MSTFAHDSHFRFVEKLAEAAYELWVPDGGDLYDTEERKGAYIQGYIHGYYRANTEELGSGKELE